MSDVDFFKQETAKRLKDFIYHNKINQVTFAESVGIKRSTLAAIFSKGGGISSEVINGIIKQYPNLNWNWLYTGEGGMLKSSNMSLVQSGITMDGDNSTNVTSVGHNNVYNSTGHPVQANDYERIIAEKDRLLAEKDRLIEELARDKEALRKDKERLWSMLEKK